MIYVIIGAVAAFVLLLLFWDDHDSAYDRGDGRSRYSRKAKAKEKRAQSQAQQQEPLEEGERYDDEAKTDLSFLDSLYYYEHLQENTKTFDIAGLTYHCTVLDRGQIVGYVKPDPMNQHDPRAQSVYRYDGKLLGYIPRKQQDWYEDFNQQNVMRPFVGEITVDRRGWMTAEIKAIIPVNKSYVQKEIEFGL